MFTSIGGLYFSWWTYKQQQETKLLVSCNIVEESPIEFKPISLSQFLYGEEGMGPMYFESPPSVAYLNYHPDPERYKGMVSFFVKCLITNMASKNVSIENINSFLEFKVLNEESEFQSYKLHYEGAFQGVFKDFNTSLQLPILLVPGEQFVCFIKVGWLLEEKPASVINELLSDQSKDIVTLKKVNTEWPDPRSLGIVVKSAVGTKFYNSLFVY